MTIDANALRILISYHYFRTEDLDRVFADTFTHPYPQVFLDSGAWSAFTQQVHIDPNDYIAFVKRFAHLWTTYSNLDDMTDPQRTLDNQHRMEDAGLNPLPVFHTGEPWTYLERYVTTYRYIALGKIIPYTNRPHIIMPWLTRCFRMAAGAAVYHGFGVTNWNLLLSFPWYSADSSKWGAGFRYGRVEVFDDETGRWTFVRIGSNRTCYTNAKLIRRRGFTPEEFADRNQNDRRRVCTSAAINYMAAEKWLRRHHGPVVLPHTTDTGFKQYLADAHITNLQYADVGFKQYLAAVTHDLNYLNTRNNHTQRVPMGHANTRAKRRGVLGKAQ